MKATNAIKLISTDFDGTLFAEFENPPVPERLQKLIDSLQAQGAKWVINTGRDMSSLMETLGRANLRIEPDYLVLVEREIYYLEDSEYVSLTEWNSACTEAHAALFARCATMCRNCIGGSAHGSMPISILMPFRPSASLPATTGTWTSSIVTWTNIAGAFRT